MKKYLKILFFLSIAVICDLMPLSCYPQSIIPAKDNSNNLTIYRGGVQINKEFRVPRTKAIFTTSDSIGCIYFDSAGTKLPYYNDGTGWIPFGSGGGGSGTVTSITASGYMLGGTVTTSGAFTPDTSAGKLATKSNLNSYFLLANITSGITPTDNNHVIGNLGLLSFLNTNYAPLADSNIYSTVYRNDTGNKNLRDYIATKGTGSVTSVIAGTGLSGGTITTTGTISMPNVGAAGTHGTSTVVPVITTDAQGRVTTLSDAAINYAWSNLTGIPATTLNGDISGTGTPGTLMTTTLTTTGVTASTYGSATTVPTITVDAKGRITAASNTAITTAILTPTGVKTTAYNANVGEYVLCNPNPSSFIVTLPNNPADKSLVGFDLVDTLGANTVTVNTQGVDVFQRPGGPTSHSMSQRNESVIYQYISSTHEYINYAGYLSKTNLISVGTAAGGDLTGTYPNPTLITKGTAGTYGSTTAIPVFTTDANGRVTSVTTTSVTPSGAAGGNLTGTYPNPSINTGTAYTWTNSNTFTQVINGTAALASDLAPITVTTFTPTLNGITSPTSICWYYLKGAHELHVHMNTIGNASGTACSFVLPNGYVASYDGIQYMNSNSAGTHAHGAIITAANSATVTCSSTGVVSGSLTLTPAAWSGSNPKGFSGEFIIFINGGLILSLLIIIRIYKKYS